MRSFNVFYAQRMSKITLSSVARDVLFKSNVFRFTERCVRGLTTSSHTRNSSKILYSSLSDVTVPDYTIPEFIWQKSARWSEKIALVCSDTGRFYTYNNLYKNTRVFAASLRLRLKLQSRDTVAVVLPNIPEYGIISLGILEANLVLSPVNPLYTPDEIQRQLIMSQSKCVITSDVVYPAVSAAIKDQTHIKVIVINTQNTGSPKGTINFKELLDNNIDTTVLNSYKYDLNEMNLLPFSSGTTGLPKGVKLTHKNIVSNMTQLQHKDCYLAEETTESYQETIPVILPLFHIYGLVVVFLDKLSVGSKMVTMPKFSSEKYIKLIREFQPTILYLVPPIVLLMIASKELKSEDVAKLRIMMSGAAPLGGKDMQRFLAKFGTDINCLQGYGLTETSPVIAFHNRVIPETDKASVGGLIPNTQLQTRHLDTQAPLDIGESGEIYVQGPQVMLGYLNNEEANKEIFTEDGWLKTGDIGYYDEKGQLYITDRMKELIKVKGFQVAPAELEEILRSHPDVQDVAVIGVSDQESGEVPKAFVVPNDSKKPSEEQLKEFVASHVAPYKRLTGGVTFLDAIPKSASGKILRRQLKKEHS